MRQRGERRQKVALCCPITLVNSRQEYHAASQYYLY